MRYKTGKRFECAICGSSIYRSANKILRNKHQYCSRKCYCIGHKTLTRHKVNRYRCSYCQNEFISRDSQKIAKYGLFCCHAHYGLWRAANLSGHNSPNWKGGKTLDYGGSHWKAQRKKARKRDNSTCQKCGATKQTSGYRLDVHHIVSYKKYKHKDRANRLANLITLCRQCHMDAHYK